MEINKLLRQKCIEKGISVRQLEIQLGFSNGYIQSIKSPLKNFERAKAIADALEIPVNSLLCGTDEQSDSKTGGNTETPDFQPVLDYIERKHGSGATEAIRMLLELDPEDRAEIRGEMRAILRNKDKQ